MDEHLRLTFFLTAAITAHQSGETSPPLTLDCSFGFPAFSAYKVK